MTRADLRALMAAIITPHTEDESMARGSQYAVYVADAILAETHPEPDVTIAPGLNVVYSDGSPVPNAFGDIVAEVRAFAERDSFTTTDADGRTEVVGFDDLNRVLDEIVDVLDRLSEGGEG